MSSRYHPNFVLHNARWTCSRPSVGTLNMQPSKCGHAEYAAVPVWACWTCKHLRVNMLNMQTSQSSNAAIKLRSLSPHTNYTNRATAACRWTQCQICEERVPNGQRDGFLWPYSRLYRPEPQLFLPSSSSIVLTRMSEPGSRPTTSQKIW
jgi:hypothetical protein